MVKTHNCNKGITHEADYIVVGADVAGCVAVHGVKNLRVADTSVYRAPNLHAFNTSRAAYLMGEVVADRIINKY